MGRQGDVRYSYEDCNIDHEHDDRCGKRRKKKSCCNSFQVITIVAVCLVALLAAIFFTWCALKQISVIDAYDPKIFASTLAVSRASDYIKAAASFLWLDILLAVVPIALLCDIPAECKGGDKYIREKWFAKFGTAILFAIVVLFAQGIACMYLTARATHVAGCLLFFAVIVGAVSAITLGGNWKMVIQLVAITVAFGLAIYLVVVSPGFYHIAHMHAGSVTAVIP